MKEIAAEVMRIVGSGGSKGTGKDPGEPVKKAKSGWKAPFGGSPKTPRAKTTAGGRKASRPGDVIPFEESGFKDF